MKTNDCITAVLKELESADAEVLGIEQNKHTHIRLRRKDGVERTVIAAVSPSDWRAPLRARAFVRRMLKEQPDALMPVSNSTQAEPEELPRTRQAPHPMRSKNRLSRFHSKGGEHQAPHAWIPPGEQVPKPARPCKAAPNRGTAALLRMIEIMRGLPGRWLDFMAEARARNMEDFIGLLAMVRVKRGLMDKSWKEFDRLEMRLTQELAAEFGKATAPMESELRSASKRLRNEMKPEDRLAYIAALRRYRFYKKLRRAEHRAESKAGNADSKLAEAICSGNAAPTVRNAALMSVTIP